MDVTAIVTTTQYGWRIVAKLPLISQWLIRWRFPVGKCRGLLAVSLPSNDARFELMRIRPSYGLIGLNFRLHNHLPFDVTFDAFRLTATIDSNSLLDQVLNTTVLVPGAASALISLPEIPLSNQQADWLRNLKRESARVRITLHSRCRSSFHHWDDQHSSEFLVSINADKIEMKAGVDSA